MFFIMYYLPKQSVLFSEPKMSTYSDRKVYLYDLRQMRDILGYTVVDHGILNVIESED